MIHTISMRVYFYFHFGPMFKGSDALDGGTDERSSTGIYLYNNIVYKVILTFSILPI